MLFTVYARLPSKEVILSNWMTTQAMSSQSICDSCLFPLEFARSALWFSFACCSMSKLNSLKALGLWSPIWLPLRDQNLQFMLTNKKYESFIFVSHPAPCNKESYLQLLCPCLFENELWEIFFPLVIKYAYPGSFLRNLCGFTDIQTLPQFWEVQI